MGNVWTDKTQDSFQDLKDIMQAASDKSKTDNDKRRLDLEAEYQKNMSDQWKAQRLRDSMESSFKAMDEAKAAGKKVDDPSAFVSNWLTITSPDTTDDQRSSLVRALSVTPQMVRDPVINSKGEQVGERMVDVNELNPSIQKQMISGAQAGARNERTNDTRVTTAQISAAAKKYSDDIHAEEKKTGKILSPEEFAQKLALRVATNPAYMTNPSGAGDYVTTLQNSVENPYATKHSAIITSGGFGSRDMTFNDFVSKYGEDTARETEKLFKGNLESNIPKFKAMFSTNDDKAIAAGKEMYESLGSNVFNDLSDSVLTPAQKKAVLLLENKGAK